MNNAVVIGYDPGGNGAHGIASVEVSERQGLWKADRIRWDCLETVAEAVAWSLEQADERRIVAAGIDTLTEWSADASGWRSADRYLRQQFPAVKNSIIAPNSIFGSMAIGGAAYLTQLSGRLIFDKTQVTEAHPKVCYFALANAQHDWTGAKSSMETWLWGQFGLEGDAMSSGEQDHCFDAAVSALAALRGLNKEWTLDLHDLRGTPNSNVRFFGPTHYWWPGEFAA